MEGTPLPVEIAWAGVDTPAHVALADAAAVQISLTSLVDYEVTVHLTAVVSADDDHIELDLPAVDLAAATTADVSLNLAQLGLADAPLLFSGLVRLRGSVFDQGNWRNLTPPQAHFHRGPTPDTLLVYGREALQTEFGAGLLPGTPDFGIADDATVRHIGMGQVFVGEYTDEDTATGELGEEGA